MTSPPPDRADGGQRPERRRGRSGLDSLSMRRRGAFETCSDDRVHSDGAADRTRAASGEGVGAPGANGAGPEASVGPDHPAHGPDEGRWHRPAWLGAAALAVVIVLVTLVALVAMAAGAFSADGDGALPTGLPRSAIA